MPKLYTDGTEKSSNSTLAVISTAASKGGGCFHLFDKMEFTDFLIH